MSENKKSFWSSVPGLVTGLAGLLTGIVGLVTVLIQLNVIGNDDKATPPAGITTTVAPVGSPATSAAGGTVTTAISGSLAVEPASLKLGTGEREKSLTVRNRTTATVTVLKPGTTGPDFSAFTTDAGCTNVALRQGESCTVKVQLVPTGPLRTYKAAVRLEAKEIPQVTEVPVEATTLL